MNDRSTASKCLGSSLTDAALFAGLYFAAAELGHWLTIGPTHTATFWPPAGLYVAVLLRSDARRWPIFLLAALAGNAASDVLVHDKPILLALGFWLANSVEAFTSAYCIRRLFGVPFDLSRVRNVLGFVLIAAFGSPLLGAAIGASLIAMAFDGAAFLNVLTVWWAGDAVGVLVLGIPILQLLRTTPRPRLRSIPPRRIKEAALMLAAVIGFSELIFGHTRFLPIAYLVGPVLLWPALRFGTHGVGWMLLVFAVVAVRNTAGGWGPFAVATVPAWGQVVLVQTFICISSVTAIVLATVVSERQRAMDALRTANTDLESKVAERTEDLTYTNKILRRTEDQLRELNASLERQVRERTEALRESERRFRAIFDSQFQFIGLMSPNGVLLEANQTALAAAGISKESVLGKLFWETPWWTHDAAQQERLRQAVACAASGQRVRLETTHRVQDGSLIWVDFSLMPIRSDDDRIVLLIPEGRDITARKRVEEALRESEERFRTAFDHAPIGVALIAPDGKWLRVNRSLCELVGYSDAELLSTDTRAIAHPDDLEAYLGRVREMLAGSIHTCQMEKRYVRKDGHVVHTLLSVSLAPDSEGKPLYFIAQIEDISLWKQAERRLVAQDALLRQFIKHSPAAIAMFDREMRYLQTSDRWLTDYGLSGQNIIGLSHYTLLPHIPDRWKEIHRRVLAGNVEACDEDAYRRADGSTDWVQWECRPWLNAEGDVGGIIIFAQVITHRKLADELVRNSLREKEVLLMEIHHRVKNNLQIVSTLLDLQASHTQDQQALDMFKETRGRVKSMAFVHERLYQSHDLARVNFAEYIRQLTNELYRSHKLSTDRIALEVEVNVPRLSIDIAIPCGLLLNELISNCLKHAFRDAETGRIQVFLSTRDENTKTLTVADDGAGFPLDIDFRNTRSFGMQLVNTLVQQLKGHIHLTNERGTKFTVTFPAKEGRLNRPLQ